jgi:predicted negative regulator of RcsB-dependent stress response
VTRCPRRALTWLLLGAAGCAYYNGLYNANRLADQARAAEREGRSGEARSLWGQAAVKAESVATRFSTSKWRDDALLLWGRGLKESGDCRRAQRPLALAVDSSPDAGLRQRARLLLGECRFDLRQYDSAVATLTPVVAQGDRDLAQAALWWRGRAEMGRGAYQAAVQDLQAAGPVEAAFDLSIAYTVLGRVEEARAVLEARLPSDYDEEGWLAALDSLGSADTRAASELVDGLAVRSDLTSGQRARLLLSDGERWEAVGQEARAAERYALAQSAAPDSVDGAAAEVRLSLVELRRAETADRLPEMVATLERAARRGGEARRIAAPYARAVRLAAILVGQPELDPSGAVMFGAAEFVRDSLGAAALAASLFWKIHSVHGESFVAPKALLAVASLDPATADSAVALLERLHRDSPYRLALDGGAGEAFQAAEDSLRLLIARGLGDAAEELGVEGAEAEELRRDR